MATYRMVVDAPPLKYRERYGEKTVVACVRQDDEGFEIRQVLSGSNLWQRYAAKAHKSNQLDVMYMMESAAEKKRVDDWWNTTEG